MKSRCGFKTANKMEQGKPKSSDSMTWDELVTVFGRPIAEEIIKSRMIKHGDNKVFIVKEVDMEKKTVTVGGVE